MIHLQNVSKSFTIHKGGKPHTFWAVCPTSLEIQQGEIFGLMGYSGAGKSTLLRLINLLERPDSGQVIIDDQDLMTLTAPQLRQARHNIGMIFQQFNLMNNRTVFDNVLFNLNVCHYQGNKQKRVQECLEIVGLTERQNHYPAQLSGGQKQRVGIARAIASSPKVLLADEPTSALDPQTTKSLLEVLTNINQTLGVTIVIVTHEMNVIKKLCHRTALLSQGEILEVANITNQQIQATTDIGKQLIDDD